MIRESLFTVARVIKPTAMAAMAAEDGRFGLDLMVHLHTSPTSGKQSKKIFFETSSIKEDKAGLPNAASSPDVVLLLDGLHFWTVDLV